MCFWSRKCRVDCGFFIARGAGCIDPERTCCIPSIFLASSLPDFHTPCFVADVIFRAAVRDWSWFLLRWRIFCGETAAVQPAGRRRYCFAELSFPGRYGFNGTSFCVGGHTKRKPGWLARLLLRRVGCGYITARRDWH